MPDQKRGGRNKQQSKGIMKTATFLDIFIISLIRSFVNIHVVPTLW